MIYLKHLLTARNGNDWSFTKLAGACTVGVMLFNFVKVASVDFSGLGLAVGGVLAAMAAKYHVENKE